MADSVLISMSPPQDRLPTFSMAFDHLQATSSEEHPVHYCSVQDANISPTLFSAAAIRCFATYWAMLASFRRRELSAFAAPARITFSDLARPAKARVTLSSIKGFLETWG